MTFQESASSMAEKCPLGFGLYWESGTYYEGGESIPEICTEQCWQSMDEAVNKKPIDIDVFVSDEKLAKADTIEYGNTSLQRNWQSVAERIVSILHVDSDGDDLFAEEYPPFTCPNN